MQKINFISDIDNYESHFDSFISELIAWIYSEIHTTNQNHMMIDVGANTGTITKILLDYVDKSTGLVIAIDAHPNWLEEFQYVDHPMVQKYNIGCYSKKCTKSFIDQDELTGLGFIGMSPVKETLDPKKLKSFQINCDILDNLVKTDKHISFIKIDAESSDFEIILGGEQLIRKHRPCIIFEFSGQIFERVHAHSRDDFFKFFKDINYSLFSVGLGRSESQILQNWDQYTLEFKDILAVPSEYIDR